MFQVPQVTPPREMTLVRLSCRDSLSSSLASLLGDTIASALFADKARDPAPAAISTKAVNASEVGPEAPTAPQPLALSPDSRRGNVGSPVSVGREVRISSPVSSARPGDLSNSSSSPRQHAASSLLHTERQEPSMLGARLQTGCTQHLETHSPEPPSLQEACAALTPAGSGASSMDAHHPAHLADMHVETATDAADGLSPSELPGALSASASAADPSGLDESAANSSLAPSASWASVSGSAEPVAREPAAVSLAQSDAQAPASVFSASSHHTAVDDMPTPDASDAAKPMSSAAIHDIRLEKTDDSSAAGASSTDAYTADCPGATEPGLLLALPSRFHSSM